MKTTLFAALNAATTLVCDGYEVEDFWETDNNVMTLSLANESLLFFKDQEIELDEEVAKVLAVTGEVARIEFWVNKPLSYEDL